MATTFLPPIAIVYTGLYNLFWFRHFQNIHCFPNFPSVYSAFTIEGKLRSLKPKGPYAKIEGRLLSEGYRNLHIILCHNVFQLCLAVEVCYKRRRRRLGRLFGHQQDQSLSWAHRASQPGLRRRGQSGPVRPASCSQGPQSPAFHKFIYLPGQSRSGTTTPWSAHRIESVFISFQRLAQTWPNPVRARGTQPDRVQVKWVSGHTGIEGNEEAGREAKVGCQASVELPLSPTSIAAAKWAAQRVHWRCFAQFGSVCRYWSSPVVNCHNEKP